MAEMNEHGTASFSAPATEPAFRAGVAAPNDEDGEFDPASNPRSLRHCTEIRPNIYLGQEAHADNDALLKQLGITHILACIGGRVEHRSDGIQHLRVPMCDRGVSDLDEVFAEAFQFLAESIGVPGDEPPSGNPKVLIHCKLGVNRSATCTVGWLMCSEKLPLKQAHAEVHSKRDVLMHDSYVDKLRELDFRLFGKHSTEPDELPCTSKVMKEAMAEVAANAAAREAAAAIAADAVGESPAKSGGDEAESPGLSPVRDE